MAEQLSADEEEAILERIVRNQLEIQRLQEENDTLKGFYKQDGQQFKAGTYREVGKFYIRVTENRRLDEALIREVMPESNYSGYYKSVPDTAKIKRTFGQNEAHMKKLYKTFANRIEVGLK